ncbi:MAG: hypothetical protein QM703_18510 [Gemmatales bacterium]
MQRKWRIGRLILAGLFLSLAGLAFAYWPATMRWEMPYRYLRIVGFCQKQNILLVTSDVVREQLMEELLAIEKHEPVVLKPTSFELYGLNLDTGEKSLLHQFPKASSYQVEHQLSPDGEHLILERDNSSHFTMINIVTGEEILSGSHPGHDEFKAMTYSQDGRWFVFARRNSIEIWDLVERRCKHQIERSSLGIKSFIESQHGEYQELGKYVHGIGLSISQDNRYLAVTMQDVLTVFDFATMQPLGQSYNHGVPQFLTDGSLALIDGQGRRPLKPISSLFHIDQGKLVRTMVDEQDAPAKHRFLSSNATTFLTAQISEPTWQWPEWVPSSVRSYFDESFSLSKKKWTISLRDLTSRKEMLTRQLVMTKDSGGRLFCATGMSDEDIKNHVPYPGFDVSFSPDHSWLAKADEHSIELWPLLTWWRPWYCWAMVAGLVVGAGYFVWNGRRVVSTGPR